MLEISIQNVEKCLIILSLTSEGAAMIKTLKKYRGELVPFLTLKSKRNAVVDADFFWIDCPNIHMTRE